MEDLIKREDAIKAVRESRAWHFNEIVPVLSAIKGIPSVEPTIEIDAHQLAKLLREGWTIHSETKQEWIPCSERLPEEVRTSYWICTDDGYQCQCRWTNVNPCWSDLTTDWHWNPCDAPQYSEVVAWMPLPKPWEGVDDED